MEWLGGEYGGGGKEERSFGRCEGQSLAGEGGMRGERQDKERLVRKRKGDDWSWKKEEERERNARV